MRAIILAVVVHAAFFALIIFGVTWQSSPTPPIAGGALGQATRRPPRPNPRSPRRREPEPAKPEPPKPEPPKPEPAKEPPREEPAPPPKPDPAIAQKLEREKKERAEKDKRERAKQEEAEKKKRGEDEAAKKKREDDKRHAEEEKRAQGSRARARRGGERRARSVIDGFVAQIKAKIRGRANVPDTVSGKPSVQVRIRILPGGEVLDIAITRSSGNRVYDTAIERAIRSASPLPVPEPTSELFPQFRDLILNIEHER